MAESPLNEIEQKVTERAKILEDVKISASIKLEIASAGMILDCCYMEARALIERLIKAGDLNPDFLTGLPHVETTQKEIALAIFDFLTRRMAQQAQASQIQQPIIRLGDPSGILSQS